MNATITISNELAVLGVMLGGGVGVYLFAELVKKFFGLNSSAVIHLMVVAVSIAASAAQYVLTLKNLPPEVLGMTTPAIYGISQMVYNWSRQAGGFLSQVQAYTASQKQPTAAQAADAAVAAVTVPEALTAEQPTSTSFDA